MTEKTDTPTAKETQAERCQRILAGDARLKLASELKPFDFAQASRLAAESELERFSASVATTWKNFELD